MYHAPPSSSHEEPPSMPSAKGSWAVAAGKLPVFLSRHCSNRTPATGGQTACSVPWEIAVPDPVTMVRASLFRGGCRLAAAEELDGGEAPHAKLLTEGPVRIRIHLHAPHAHWRKRMPNCRGPLGCRFRLGYQ